MQKNRPGRPALDPTGARPAVCLKLAASDFDRVYALSKARRVSMPEVIRQGLKRLLYDQRGGAL
jgi:hypothetical protein